MHKIDLRPKAGHKTAGKIKPLLKAWLKRDVLLWYLIGVKYALGDPQ